MYTLVAAKLRMKGCRQDVAFANQNGLAINTRESLDARSEASDPRRPYEDSFELPACEF
jgi:hypothetical protein